MNGKKVDHYEPNWRNQFDPRLLEVAEGIHKFLGTRLGCKVIFVPEFVGADDPIHYVFSPSDDNTDLDDPRKSYIRSHVYADLLMNGTNVSLIQGNIHVVHETSLLAYTFGAFDPMVLQALMHNSEAIDREKELQKMFEEIEAKLRMPDDFMPGLEGNEELNELRSSMWQSRHVDPFAQQPWEEFDGLDLDGDGDEGLDHFLKQMARERQKMPERQDQRNPIPDHIRKMVFELFVSGVTSVDFYPEEQVDDDELIVYLRNDAQQHFGPRMDTFEKLTAHFEVAGLNRMAIQIQAHPRGGQGDIPDLIEQLKEMLGNGAEVDVKVVNLSAQPGQPQSLDDVIRQMLMGDESPATNRVRSAKSRDDSDLIGLKARKQEQQAQTIRAEDIFTAVKKVVNDKRLEKDATNWLTELGTNVAMNLLNQLAGMFLALLTFPFRWAWNKVVLPAVKLLVNLIIAFTLVYMAVFWSLMTILTMVNIPVWIYFTMRGLPFSAAFYSTLMGWGVWAVANFLFGIATGLKVEIHLTQASRIPDHPERFLYGNSEWLKNWPNLNVVIWGIKLRHSMHRTWEEIKITPREMWEVVWDIDNTRERALYDFKPYDYNWLVRSTAHTWDWFDDRKLDLEAVKEVFANPDEAKYALREPIQDPWIVLQSARLGLWLRNTVEELSRRLDAAFDPNYRAQILSGENVFDEKYVNMARSGKHLEETWSRYELPTFFYTLRSASHRRWLVNQTEYPLTFWPEKVAIKTALMLEKIKFNYTMLSTQLKPKVAWIKGFLIHTFVDRHYDEKIEADEAATLEDDLDENGQWRINDK